MVGRGAFKDISAQAQASPTPHLPLDYDYPFGKPPVLAPIDIHDPRAHPPPRRPPKQRAVVEPLQHKSLELAPQPTLHVEAPRPPQIYILGSNPRTTFITRSLADNSSVAPVRVLINDNAVMKAWQQEGERLVVHEGGGWKTSRRAVAEWIGPGHRRTIKERHIKHLVVNLPCTETVRAIEAVSHRIDHRTIICLLQDGLGLVHAINERCFQDPHSRPTYILGHMTHSLGYRTGYHHAALLKRSRKLYLYALERNPARSVRHKPAFEKNSKVATFLQTLTDTPGLNAEGVTLQGFLVKKLPTIVAKAAVDPVTVVLDCSYAEVLKNPHGRRLVDQLLDEMYNVIMSLPELPEASSIVKYLCREKLRNYAYGRLKGKGSSLSYMVNRVRQGKPIDIPFLNGWFIKRGEESGIKCPANQLIVDMVMAKRKNNADALGGNDIPIIRS